MVSSVEGAIPLPAGRAFVPSAFWCPGYRAKTRIMRRRKEHCCGGGLVRVGTGIVGGVGAGGKEAVEREGTGERGDEFGLP